MLLPMVVVAVVVAVENVEDVDVDVDVEDVDVDVEEVDVDVVDGCNVLDEGFACSVEDVDVCSASRATRSL